MKEQNEGKFPTAKREPGPTRPLTGHDGGPGGPEATTSQSGASGTGDLSGGGKERRDDHEKK